MFWAFLEAAKGLGHVRPNPPVGAVIVKNGAVIGMGRHHRAGSAHAEVMALRSAKRHGNDVRGATIYTTLEPCSRPGRVGACTDAIAAAGLKRVVYGAVDPNPVNRGRAARVLARQGIACDFIEDDCGIRRKCEKLIQAFTKHVQTGLPFVTVKIALSLDGKICDDKGRAKWISGEKARALTWLYREAADVIMVGAETIRKDNPSLLSHGKRNDDLVRVIVSASGKLPKNARVFTDGCNETLVMKPDSRGLRGVLEDLGKRGFSWVFCEGGLKLATALAEEGLVDEWVTVLAPCVIGRRPIERKIVFAQPISVVCGEDVVVRLDRKSNRKGRSLR